MKGKPTMTLKELLTITNINSQVAIYIESKNKDDLIPIFKGDAEDAIKYFKGVDSTMNSKVEFININKSLITQAPRMNIVIA